MARAPLGYDDTPLIPGTRFRVHDASRPQPRRVHPGPTEHLALEQLQAVDVPFNRALTPRQCHRRLDGGRVLKRNIEDLQREALTVGKAERKLFAIFHRRLLPARPLVPVADAYFSAESSTSWALLNACTAATKTLTPGPNLKATVRLGRFFGLGRNGHSATTS